MCFTEGSLFNPLSAVTLPGLAWTPIPRELPGSRSGSCVIWKHTSRTLSLKCSSRINGKIRREHTLDFPSENYMDGRLQKKLSSISFSAFAAFTEKPKYFIHENCLLANLQDCCIRSGFPALFSAGSTQSDYKHVSTVRLPWGWVK